MDTSIRSKPDLYDVLGVTPAATKDDISDAYAARLRKLSLASDDARELMSAYKTLSDPEKRMAYDISRGLAPEPHAEDQSEQQASPHVVPFIAANDGKLERRAAEVSPASSQQSAKGADHPAVGRIDEPEGVVGAAQGYSVGYFARKHNLSRQQARELIDRVGHHRDKLNAAAEQLKAGGAPAGSSEPNSGHGSSPASDHVPVIQPNESTPEAQGPLFEQAECSPAYDQSSERKRLPAAAKVGAGLLGVGILAGGALLISGSVDRTDSTPRAGGSLSNPSQGGVVTPQTSPPRAPSPPTIDVSELALERPSVKSVKAPTTDAGAASEQIGPSAPAQADDGQTRPSSAPEVASASPGTPAGAAPAAPDVPAAAPAPATAGAATVTQALRGQPPAPNVRALPKLIGGAIGARDNPRGKWQGIVNVQFTVERNGQVTGCKAVASSGNSALDARTCQLVEQRLRFSPAEDTQGQPVSWQMSATYIWGTKKWRTKR